MPAINNSDEDMSETERLLQNPVLDTDESSGGHAPSIRGPSDRFNAALIIFFILGIGSLLPWNFFINAKQYFLYKLHNTNISSDEAWLNSSYFTKQQVLFLSEIEIAAMVPSVVFQFVNVGIAQVFSWKWRIIASLSVTIVMFLLTVVFTQLNTFSYQSTFAGVTLMTAAVMSASSALFQGGVYGLAAYFPRRYMQSLMTGGAMAGLLSSLVNILTLVFGSSPEQSGFVYFLLADVGTVVTLAAFILLLSLNYSVYQISCRGFSSVDYIVSEASSSDSSTFESGSRPHDDESTAVVAIVEKPSLLLVLKQIWVEELAVFFIFCVTLLCFPALNSAIESVAEGKTEWTSVYFVPVTCFVLFNASDLLGRLLAGVVNWPTRFQRPLLVIGGLLRVGLIPIFMFCNVQPRSHLPVVFNHDFVPMVALFLLASSNGYFGTLCMIYGPRRVSAINGELAGVVMSFFLNIGLGCGAVLSILLIKSV